MTENTELKSRIAAWIDRQVGDRLRTRRVELGITQDEVAEMLGISYQQVQKYESGTNRISTGRMYQIARFLDIEIAELFDGLEMQVDRAANLEASEGEPSRNRAIVELVRHFQRIADAPQRSAVLNLVRSLSVSETASNDVDSHDMAIKANGQLRAPRSSGNVVDFRGSEKR